ncbi:uncharacterized protein LOC143220519 [Lasioglossum baleicum]|uniref:uncharacterized protein LOC143220519 n=1 Tax=Lasioglossum baleicum TaxID=434251 RepID=UPI003FCD328A
MDFRGTISSSSPLAWNGRVWHCAGSSRTSEGRTREYAGVIHSMALYGAPVCAADLTASRKRCARLASVWRKLAIRVMWGYRTLSHEAPFVLTGLLSLDLLAGMETRTYDLVRRRLSGLPSLGPEEEDNIKKEIRRSGLEEWRRRLSRQA